LGLDVLGGGGVQPAPPFCVPRSPAADRPLDEGCTMDEVSDTGQVVDEEQQGDDEGAALVEYALLLALIAIVCVVAVTVLGTSLSSNFDSSSTSLYGP